MLAVGDEVIVAWLVWFGLAIVAFAVLETIAIRSGRWTLSRLTYEIGARWPLFLVLWGMVVGGLAVHFFWHFCPPGSVQGG